MTGRVAGEVVLSQTANAIKLAGKVAGEAVWGQEGIAGQAANPGESM